MQINSLSGATSTQPLVRDDVRQAVGQSSPKVPSGNVSAAPVEVSQDAVQALDAKAQAEQLGEAVKKINETIGSMNKNVGLEFSTDEDTKLRMVRVVDVASKEVLRQIPTEEVINIAKAIDKLQGLLVRDKA